MADWQITLDGLRELLSDPIGISDPGAAALERATTDAYALAKAAFERDDVGARLFAERVLHVIQTHTHFAPPMHGVPAIYWGVLLRAKMRAELRMPSSWPELTAGADTLTSAEFKRRLETAVKEHGCHNHPYLEGIAQEKGNRFMTVYAKNWYGSCQGFSQQLIQLVQRTSGPVRKSVADNVADEFAGVSHDELRNRFIEAVGFRYDAWSAVADPDRVPESYALMSYRTAICQMNNTLFSLGSFYTTEANWPLECNVMLQALRKRGLSEHDLEYWVTHSHADEDHAAEWLDVLVDFCTTPTARQQALIGALAQLHLRRRMYDVMLALANAR